MVKISKREVPLWCFRVKMGGYFGSGRQRRARAICKTHLEASVWFVLIGDLWPEDMKLPKKTFKDKSNIISHPQSLKTKSLFSTFQKDSK